jgi:putative DNA primase/helicase
MELAKKVVDEAIAETELTPAEKVADDWLVAFSKKSEEALAKRAAEKQTAPRPDEAALVSVLARKGHIEYDRMRSEVAETLGVRVGTLDDKVEAARAERTATRGVIFPAIEPASSPVDGDALLISVSGRIRRHIVASEHLFTAATLWTAFAWTHDAYAHSPLLLATSKEPNSGKTTLVELLKLLVPRGLSAVDMTGPTLFRFIEKFNPTFILDEADTIFRENEQLRMLFNSGWTRGSGVPRIDPDTLEPEVFPTFAPKIVGMKGLKLPDTTLGRAIVLEMQRKLPGEVVEDFEYLDDAELHMLRGQFARWAADNMESLRQAKPAVPEGFYNRVACNWRPLLAVADRAGGDWPELARKAAEALTGKDPGTVYAETLAAIRTILGDSERMFSEDIVRELHAIEGGPWAEWGKSGKPISQNALARLLKPIAPEQMRIGHESKKGYERSQFKDFFARYLPPEPESTSSQPKQRNKCDEIRTSSPFATETAKNGVSDGKCEKPNNDGLCFGVSDGKGGNGDRGHIGPRICAQCNSGAEPLTRIDGVWLHADTCVRFWLKDHPAASGIPDCLRRLPPALCAYCGQPADHQPLLTVADGARMGELHRRCEIPWANGEPRHGVFGGLTAGSSAFA